MSQSLVVEPVETTYQNEKRKYNFVLSAKKPAVFRGLLFF